MWSKCAFGLFGLAYLTLIKAQIYSLDTTACLKAPYSSYLYLSSCDNALALCGSHYQVYCTIWVTTTSTATVTASTIEATTTKTTVVTETKHKKPTATVTYYNTIIKYVTRSTTYTETVPTIVAKRTAEDAKRMARKDRRAIAERQTALPESCISGNSVLWNTGEIAYTVCPCIERVATCFTRTAEAYATVTETVPYTTTRFITKTTDEKVTSEIKTITKDTTIKVMTTLFSFTTKYVPTRPCKDVETWPLYRQHGGCDGHFALSGHQFNSNWTACCVQCWNDISCSSFEMVSDLNGPNTCNLYQNQVPAPWGNPNPAQCAWGVPSISKCPGHDDPGPPNVRLGPCGVP